jgi:hypothetical protein
MAMRLVVTVLLLVPESLFSTSTRQAWSFPTVINLNDPQHFTETNQPQLNCFIIGCQSLTLFLWLSLQDTHLTCDAFMTSSNLTIAWIWRKMKTTLISSFLTDSVTIPSSSIGPLTSFPLDFPISVQPNLVGN